LREDIEGFIQKVEEDEELKSYVGENKPLSGRLLNRVGSLMEREGLGAVEVCIKVAAKDEVNLTPYQRLYEYAKMVESLNVPRAVKGYLLKKLEAIATIKIDQ